MPPNRRPRRTTLLFQASDFRRQYRLSCSGLLCRVLIPQSMSAGPFLPRRHKPSHPLRRLIQVHPHVKRIPGKPGWEKSPGRAEFSPQFLYHVAVPRSGIHTRSGPRSELVANLLRRFADLCVPRLCRAKEIVTVRPGAHPAWPTRGQHREFHKAGLEPDDQHTAGKYDYCVYRG